uniref:Uncharacterized protein n=1 Tax=viral metagenome TaxID=1070528 RepID=A0A6C0CX68_9ZZZZ
MDLNINTWNITLTQNNIDNYDIHTLLHSYFMPRYDSMTYLLNTTQDKYSVIEKFVYDTAMFHLQRLGIEYNKDEHLIEFWFKHMFESTCHVDTDEYERQFNDNFKYEENEPMFTSITYFSNSNIPTIISDITSDDYLNDNYSEKNKIFLSFPKYLKQITFRGGKYYHGTCKVFENEISSERKILSIIIWNKKKVKVPYFDNHIFQYTNYTKHKIQIYDVTIDNDTQLLDITKLENNAKFIINNNENLIHKSLFEKFIDKKNGQHGDLFYRFSNILNENNFEKYEIIELSNNNVSLLEGMNIKEKCTEKITNGEEKNKKNNQENIIKKDIFTKQLMIEKLFFDHVICDWIINNTQKYILKKKVESLSSINIDSLKNVQPFVIFSLEKLFKTKIVDFYNLNDEKQNFMIKNIHILKVDNNNLKIQNFDNYHLTIKIILNNHVKLIFKDGTNIILNKGDFIIHHKADLIENIIFNKYKDNDKLYILVADIFSL